MSNDSVRPADSARATRVERLPTQTPSARPAAPTGAAARILALQRQAGNRAVSAALGQRATSAQPSRAVTPTQTVTPTGALAPIQALAATPRLAPASARGTSAPAPVTTPACPYVVQRAPSPAEKRQLEAKLAHLRSQAGLLTSGANLGEAYGNLALGTTDLISTKLQLFALQYRQAWSRYSAVIGAGRAEAQNQTLWRGIFLGIATGVVAGVAAAFIAPSTAAGWFTLTVADAATAAGSSLLQAGFSSAVAFALSDAMTVRGSDLQPTGLSPDMLKANIWQQVAQMYKGAFGTTKVTTNFLRHSVALEKTIAELRVHLAGGASDFSTADVLRAAEIESGRLAAMQTVLTGLRTGAGELQKFSAAVVAYDPMKPTVDKMEDDIWIMWIGSLSDDDSDILDLDAIEDHLHKRGILGGSSRLGVDFGDYTSEDDELAAIAAGRRQAATIRATYDQSASKWNKPPGP